MRPIKTTADTRSPEDARAFKKLDRELRKFVRLEKQHRAAVDRTVAKLRTPGLDGHCLATWEEIGAALGINRSAAQQRYSELSWGGGPFEAPEGPAEPSSGS